MAAQQLAGLVLGRGEREQQVFGGDVLVLHRVGFAEGRLERAGQRGVDLRLGTAVDLGLPLEEQLDGLEQRVDRDSELLEYGHRAALGLREQRTQQVRRLDL